MKNEQYNFLQEKTQKLLNAYSTVNDESVLQALKQVIKEEVIELVSEMGDENKEIILSITEVSDRETAERYLAGIKPLVSPLISLDEEQLKKLFPKTKKLRVPSLKQVPLHEISYLSWNDQGSNKKYMVAPYNDRILALQGAFSTNHQKNICSICHKHETVGLFSVESKGKVPGTYTVKGNYICVDYIRCNKNVTSLQKLHEFLYSLST